MVNFDQVTLNEGNEESFKENAQMFGPAKAKMRVTPISNVEGMRLNS